MPDDAMLGEALGAAKRHWDDVLAALPPGLERSWKHYGKTYGWQLEVADRRRAILYMIPRRGTFTAAMALDPAALQEVRSSKLPAALVQAIVDAPAQREGRAARVDVTTRAHVGQVQRLLAIKLGSR